jgi:hypothetical protein
MQSGRLFVSKGQHPAPMYQATWLCSSEDPAMITFSLIVWVSSNFKSNFNLAVVCLVADCYNSLWNLKLCCLVINILFLWVEVHAYRRYHSYRGRTVGMNYKQTARYCTGCMLLLLDVSCLECIQPCNSIAWRLKLNYNTVQHLLPVRELCLIFTNSSQRQWHFPWQAVLINSCVNHTTKFVVMLLWKGSELFTPLATEIVIFQNLH